MPRSLRPAYAAAIAAVLAGVLVLTACAGFDASKSGGGTLPLTIRLSTADSPGRAGSDEVETFAREIEERSDGAITVEIRWESHLGEDAGNPAAEDTYEGGSYTEVARQVEDGETELALVPDFAWIARGADDVSALKVPFLIDSVELMKAVAQQEGANALTDLAELGVTPLALLPESIRHPVGFDHALISPADYAERGIRVADSSVEEIIAAWGGRAIRAEAAFAAGIMSGEIGGADSAFVQSVTLPRPGIFTADVSYAAKFNTLVASGSWWDALAAGHRAVISAAAAATLEESLRTTPSDDIAGAQFCEGGGTIVHAGTAGVEALEAAAAPIIAARRTDPDTRDLVQAIEVLKAAMPPAKTAAECAPEPAPPLAGDPGETEAFPEGSFRAELTVKDFTDRGIDLGTAQDHAQIWTLTFRDGQVLDIGCPGSTYAVRDGRVSIQMGTGAADCGSVAGGELFSATWTFDGAVLRFSDVGPGLPGSTTQTFGAVLWGSQDWVKLD